MTWELALAGLFDELETEAHGQALAARAEDVADLARVEYADIGLEARLSGSVGEPVRLDLFGATLRGRLLRVGRGCLVVGREDHPRRPVLVNLEHAITAHTPSTRATSEQVRPLTSKLGLASALRHLVTDEDRLLVLLRDGRVVSGEVERVGADFVELSSSQGAGQETMLVPMAMLVTVEPA